MDPWSIGLVAVVVVGLVVIVYGALSDRRRNARRATEMMAPPQRTIPQFSPDAATPQYLSELQARRPPTSRRPPALTASERQELTVLLESPVAVTVPAGYASRDFISDPASSWAVVTHPRVLVCDDGVDSMRELLPILEKLILSRTPLVLVAPSIAREVLGTLEVNQIRGTLSLLVVTSDAADARGRLARATGATVISRSDLQSGYVLPEQLGRCWRWVSDARRSVVLTDEPDPTPPDHQQGSNP